MSESCHAGNECEGWGMKGDGSENCPDLIPRCGEEYKQIQINNKVCMHNQHLFYYETVYNLIFIFAKILLFSCFR